MFLSSQLNVILMFFLSRNLRIARDRAWELTVQSRGKGPNFWGPYVEEWQAPPQVAVGGRRWAKWVTNGVARLVIRKSIFLCTLTHYYTDNNLWLIVIFAPLDLYPLVGTLISCWLKAIGTAHYLHLPYFKSKKMTDHEVALFMEERKWDYRSTSHVRHIVVVSLISPPSFRFRCSLPRELSHHRSRFHNQQPHWSCNVGAWSRKTPTHGSFWRITQATTASPVSSSTRRIYRTSSKRCWSGTY